MAKIPIYYDPSFNPPPPDYSNRNNYVPENQDSYVVQINSVTRIVDIVSISQEAKEKAAEMSAKNQEGTANQVSNGVSSEEENEKSTDISPAASKLPPTANTLRYYRTAEYAESMYKFNSSLYK